MILKRTFLLSLIVLFVIGMTGCKKEVEDGPSGPAPDGSTGGNGGGSASTQGDVTFWINQDYGCGYLYVTLSSFGEKTISGYYSSGISTCVQSGCANFIDIDYGSYYYSVNNNDGDSQCFTNGYLGVNSDCEIVEIEL